MEEVFKFLVLKYDDIKKYCSDEQLSQLNQIIDSYNNGREIYENKPINKYYVVNRDEYPQFLDNPEHFKTFLDRQIKDLSVYFVNQKTEYCGCEDEYLAYVKDDDFDHFENYTDHQAYDHLYDMDIISQIEDDNFDGRNYEELDDVERSLFDDIESANSKHDINKIDHDNPKERNNFKLYEIKYISE